MFSFGRVSAWSSLFSSVSERKPSSDDYVSDKETSYRSNSCQRAYYRDHMITRDLLIELHGVLSICEIASRNHFREPETEHLLPPSIRTYLFVLFIEIFTMFCQLKKWNVCYRDLLLKIICQIQCLGSAISCFQCL